MGTPVACAVADARAAQAVFAVAVLRGRVVPQLKFSADKLVANPDLVLKAEAVAKLRRRPLHHCVQCQHACYRDARRQ